MTALSTGTLADVGIGTIARKPAEIDPVRAVGVDVSTLAIDDEGSEYVPDRETLATLSDHAEVRLTTPVWVDSYPARGLDPLHR